MAHTAEPNLFQYQFTLIRINAKFQISGTAVDTVTIFYEIEILVVENCHVIGIGTMLVPSQFGGINQ
jgi:hypothetical protein